MPNNVSYGFHDLTHLFNTRVNEIGTQRVYDAVRASAEEYSRVASEMMMALFEPTETAQEQIEQAADGRLQPLGPSGVPLPRVSDKFYNVAYPIRGGGDAWATNRVSQALLTVGEANKNTWDSMQRDSRWLTDYMLGAILYNQAYTFNDKAGINGSKGLGDITVQPLANGDAVTYNRRGGAGTSIDDHYYAQVAAIDDANDPFSALRNELVEHPENAGGPLVAYIASNLRTSIEGLSSFKEVADPNIIYGTSDRATGAPDVGFGAEIVGYIQGENIWITELPALPSDYGFVHATGAGPIGKMREYASPALKGFFPEMHMPQSGLTQMSMIRYAGFGISMRTAAVAFNIGNGSYTVPTGYDVSIL